MNINPLRKTILKESTIFAVLLAGCVAIVVYFIMANDHLLERKDAVQRGANQVSAEMQTTDQKFMTVKDNLWLFKESEDFAKAQGLYIDSQAVRDLFNHYQAKLFLKRMSVEMRPIADITNQPVFVNGHYKTAQTTALITLDALTDEDVYRLVRIMNNKLPGFIRVTSVTMEKKAELSQSILAQVRRGGAYPMITGQVKFDWYGMVALDENSPLNRYIPQKYEDKEP